jgi:hypothetical protein
MGASPPRSVQELLGRRCRALDEAGQTGESPGNDEGQVTVGEECNVAFGALEPSIEG